MENKQSKEPRRWTLGLGLWLVLSTLATSPAWVAMYVHRNRSDNSLFEMANHTHWHFALGVLGILLLDAILFWWHRWRPGLIAKVMHLAMLLTPAVYLSMVVHPWTALPLNSFYATKKATKPLAIASWNVFIQNNKFDIIQKSIESLDADVVLLIEITPEHQKGLSKLSKSYPHSIWVPKSNTTGIAILSRIPGTKYRELSMGKSQMLALEALIPAGPYADAPIRLLGVHTASPNKNSRFLVRDEQLEDIAAWVNKFPGQTIVFGDMNITPWSDSFQKLLKDAKLQDTRVYRGYFATWPCGLGIFGIPIDHILVSSGIRVIDRECGFPTVDSDHQWIRATLDGATVDGAKVDRSRQESLDGSGKSSKSP